MDSFTEEELKDLRNIEAERVEAILLEAEEEISKLKCITEALPSSEFYASEEKKEQLAAFCNSFLVLKLDFRRTLLERK